ncbi:hypothetical protein [Streptomyces hygroscopicus]|uniref:hypothetical protein n=1 Tax=Streptomyces hygroscopicus TaxID=1912 RepID=UPI0004CB8F48|nr:hypothetical protein [Streptomyces hygroscopicus]
MMTNGKIAVAITGGYLLGRTKKAKLALGLGMLLAGKKIALDPQQLKKALAETPLLSGLNGQVRKELADATRQAATKAVSDRVNGLADALHERTAALRGGGAEERGEDEEPAEGAEGPEDEQGAEDERGAEGAEADAESEPEPKPKPPKPPRKAAAKAPARPAKKTAASGASRAKKTAKTAKTAKSAKTAKTAKAARTAGGRNG